MSSNAPRTSLVDRVAALLSEAELPEAGADAAALVEATSGDEALALQMARRRREGVPLGLLTGRVAFLGVDIATGAGALSPRLETELLGRLALSLLPGDGVETIVVDMCCGTGNLACALAIHRRGLRVFASDLTPETVNLASVNAAQLGIANRVTIVQGDLFTPLAGHGLEGLVDLIVCNPPYISTGRLARNSARLLQHEPREAFDGGPYGLSMHQRVLRDATQFLRPGGWLCFEFGVGQERQLGLLFERARCYENLRFDRDDAGQPRVVAAQLRPG